METKIELNMETKTEKKAYIAPSIRVVKFNVERGFAGSVVTGAAPTDESGDDQTYHRDIVNSEDGWF